jgi:chromosome segregation ATPase
MPFAQEDYEAIGEYVRKRLGDWLQEQSLGKPPLVYEIELRERMVRVEEELKNQRELMKQGFDLTDKRFLEMRENMNRRFEQVDKRFEQVDKRFEQVDKHFEQVDKHFEQVDKRFEQVDKRFELVDKRFEEMNLRFGDMNSRFESLTKRIDRFMVWSFGLTVTMSGVVIAVLKFT